jgi:uncharacterized membrane protein AbrB (regulator of aidB expression)
MRDHRPPLLDRLFGLIVGIFVAALLLYVAAQLIESIWPLLLTVALIIATLSVLMWWLRSRSSDW